MFGGAFDEVAGWPKDYFVDALFQSFTIYDSRFSRAAWG